MIGTYGDDRRYTPYSAHPTAETVRREEPMDDEEKILANRSDANIPALLTRDVLGG